MQDLKRIKRDILELEIKTKQTVMSYDQIDNIMAYGGIIRLEPCRYCDGASILAMRPVNHEYYGWCTNPDCGCQLKSHPDKIEALYRWNRTLEGVNYNDDPYWDDYPPFDEDGLFDDDAF